MPQSVSLEELIMYYGDKQESLVVISGVLSHQGWKIYGFNEDQSDIMTDYYHPASWDGIAVKNGFILVVDETRSGTIGGDFIRESYDPKIAKRIVKLQALADNHAASKGERDNALAMIEKFDKELVKTVTIKGSSPAINYQGNPGNSKWHIEKDGAIIAKGTGVYSFSNVDLWRENTVPYKVYEHNDYNDYYWNAKKEDWEVVYASRLERHTEDTALLNKLFNLINKWNKFALINIGEGQGEKLVKKTVTKKTVYFIQQDANSKTQYIRVGDKWKRFGGLEKGLIYKISDDGKSIKKLTLKWEKFDDGDFHTYKREPNKSTKPKFVHFSQEDVDNGDVVYIELVEKIKIFSEEVFVKVSTKKSSKPAKKVSTKKVVENISLDFETMIENGNIEDFEHSKTKEMLKVLKLEDTLSKDDFKSFLQYIKENNIGYYSKFAKGFILSEDYLDIIQIGTVEDTKEVVTNYSDETLEVFSHGSLF